MKPFARVLIAFFLCQTLALSALTPTGSLHASGQLQSQQEQGATTLNGTQSYRYDANDRLIQSTSPLGQLTYTLDANGNAVERSVSNSTSDAGTATSAFDAAGRLASVTAPDGKQTRYSYDTAGRLVLTERDLNAQGAQAQVLRTHHRYDSADRTVTIAHVKQTGATQTLMVGQALTRDAGGAVTRMEMYRAGFGLTPASFDANTGAFSGTVARTQNFEFDSNARLTRENKIDAVMPGLSLDTRYTYDAVGNRSGRTATSSAGTDSTVYTYDTADRLTQEQVNLAAGGTKTTTYTWDQNGNLESKIETGKATLYRFDPQNRLIDIRTGATQAAAQAASPSVRYAYDANGNRIKKTGPAGATNYLIDGNQAYAQVAIETTGTNSTAYVWGNQLIRQTQAGAGNLFATANAANDVFPLQGHLNTSLGAIDANGNAVEQSLSDAFGQLDTPIGLKQSHLYTGEYWDQDAQLLYLRARWYDPRIGRFVSADPFEGKQRDSRSLNRYVYASSDPVQKTDPSGLMSMGEIGAGLNTMATLSIRAYTAYNHVESFMLGNPDNDSSMGLLDTMLAVAMSALSGDDGVSLASSVVMLAVGTSNDKHHVVPVYMCGAKYPGIYAHLDPAVHTDLHVKLYGTTLAFTAIQKALVDKYLKRPGPAGRQPDDPIVRLAGKRLGREVIGNFLSLFYKSQDYQGRVYWDETKPRRRISDVFERARRDFVGGKTSLPSCKR